MKLKFKFRYSLVLIVVLTLLSQYDASAQGSALDRYIQQAIESNTVLKQKQLSYQKSLQVLKEAKGMFYPTVSVVAEYSFNSGGRQIQMPFGTIISPVYNNLDILNNLNSLSIPSYPAIGNTETPLSPEEEQRTQIQFEMPIYNKALVLNRKLQEQVSEVEKITAESYKKELVKEVKTAYVDYKISLQAFDVGQKALKMVNKSLEVSKSLYKNNKITLDELLKAEAKVKEVENENLKLKKAITLTRTYFNFLLNKKYNEEIEVDGTFIADAFLLEDLDALLKIALSNRDEIRLLDYSKLIDETNIKIEKSSAFPLLYLEGSTGYWSQNYSFNDDAFFTSVSVSLKWDVFTGTRKSKIRQAKIDKLITEEKRKELENNISLEVVEAYYNVKEAQESIQLSKKELENYKESLKMITKKKEHGLASQLDYDIAFIDFFESEMEYVNDNHQYLQKIIELEYLINK